VTGTDGRDKSRHGFLRRLMNPAFSPSSLRELEIGMRRYFEALVNSVRTGATRNDGIVEMNQLFHNLAFDVSRAWRGLWVDKWGTCAR